MPRPAVLIVDADNTLWDTNQVFANAQLAMIRSLEEHGCRFPEPPLEALRRIDRRLAREFGKFEYDFSLLAERLMDEYFPGEMPSADRELAAQGAAAELGSTLSTTPDLLPGATDLLRWIRDSRAHGARLAAILISEGDKSRLMRIASAHHLDHGTFDRIEVLATKTAEVFQDAVSWGRLAVGTPSPVCIAIGDSIERDMRPARTAGCVTIYKPAGFHGNERSTTSEAEPDYRVSDLTEALAITQELLNESPEAGA